LQLDGFFWAFRLVRLWPFRSGGEVGLSDLWMAAWGDGVGGWRVHAFAIQIKPILLPVCCPTFLKNICLRGGGDTESIKRQDHGSNTDVRRRALANMPAPGTRKNWGTDMPLGSKPLKRRVQVIA
jgi:hypothetical protein